jgi:NAD(P)-dependent dehydrogenase (short-subunit alcohol dehydrogenase family)
MNEERITTQFGAESTAAEVIAGIDLTDRRAMVTGGASGIGLETARALARANAEGRCRRSLFPGLQRSSGHRSRLRSRSRSRQTRRRCRGSRALVAGLNRRDVRERGGGRTIGDLARVLANPKSEGIS